jgi:hypothetical protein
MPGAYFIKRQASFGKAEAAKDLFAHGSAAPPTQAKRPPRAGKQVQEEGKVRAFVQLRIRLSETLIEAADSSYAQVEPPASSQRFKMRCALDVPYR